MPGAEGLEVEGLGELSGRLKLGANLMMRLGFGDNIVWSPDAEVSVPRWPVVINIVRSGNTRWLAGQCVVYSHCCGGHTRRWGSFWWPQRRPGSILRPLPWRDDICGPLKAKAAVWQLLKTEGSIWCVLEAESDVK